MRAALEALAVAAAGWLSGVVDASWQRVYAARVDSLRLPENEFAGRQLAVQYGRDGYLLLEAVYAPAAPAWLARLPAVETLRAIWVQQYYRRVDEHGQEVIRLGSQRTWSPAGRACPS